MDIIDIKKNKNNIVKKNNELIKAKSQLSATAQKMLLMLISMINTKDTEFQKYALNIADYKKEINITNKEISFYVKQAAELMMFPFKIDKKLFNWCSSVDYGSVDGYIVFEIHQDLKKYLLNLKKNFTQYELINVLQLRGKYSIKLYEIFIMKFNENKKYNPKAKNVKYKIKIEELKDILYIPKGYRYENIKKQIILKAQKDLKENTNIKFNFEEMKIGKKVNELIFTIQENNKGSNNYNDDLKSFINYMRKNFINIDILKFNDKYLNKEILLSIDPAGKLYNKLDTLPIKKERAAELWNELYKLSLADKLYCIKQGKLF